MKEMKEAKDKSSQQKQFISSCASCARPTPFCEICYQPLSYSSPVQKMMEKFKMNTDNAQTQDKFATFNQ